MGRMTLARDEAFVLLVPEVVCSVKIVVPWAIQALCRVSRVLHVRAVMPKN